MSEETDRLYDAILSSCDINCSACGKTSSVYNIDDFEAAEHFKSNGWRATIHGNVYCPDCAKKKLRSKK